MRFVCVIGVLRLEGVVGSWVDNTASRAGSQAASPVLSTEGSTRDNPYRSQPRMARRGATPTESTSRRGSFEQAEPCQSELLVLDRQRERRSTKISPAAL